MTKCYFCGCQIKELPYTCRRCGEKFCSDHRLPENHYCRGYPRHYEKKSKKRISRRTKRKILKVFGVLAIIVGLAFFYPQISSLISPLGDSFCFSDTKTGDQGFKASDIPLIGDIIDPSESFGDAPKLHNYPYYSGGRKSLSFTTYGGLSDYFSKESHTYYSDFVDEVVLELVENSYQDEYMAPLLMQIQKTSNSPDAQARIAVSLVQHIPYSWSRYAGTQSDWYYPYETLHNNQGVCSDKSLLLGYLLNRLGYDVVLFDFSDHMAVGVKCDAQYDFQNSGYAFIETTSPTILTYIPEDYVGGFTITSDVEIIHLRGGTRSVDASGEYRDAQEMKRLESMGPVLDEYNYARWQALSQKYDLFYDT
ncbi:AN1-type zinc finger protein [uncultured Methanofollis sp.]|uniref:AN1-type zinc finger protein n=1 Tax=uncultured Methanofollis sp. TaxID=262500 RepID=UPI00261050D6|nr:AN1-type zinc finger protein [uncultured Methanofollis sp.]